MRRGIILPAVLVLISLMVLLALTRNWFSRQQLHQADMISEKEQAYHAADGMRKIAVALVKKAVELYNNKAGSALPRPDKIEKPLRQIFEKILQQDGTLSRKQFSLTLSSATLEEFVEKLNQSGIKVDEHRVELSFLPQQQLLQTSKSGLGLQSDPDEISWRMILKCFARVGNGVETLLWYREGRTISLQPPLTGKFSLFVREPEENRLNELKLDQFNADGSLKNAPLLVNNGKTVARDQLEAKAAKDFIDAQGWVFMGESGGYNLKNAPGAALVNHGYFETSLESDAYLSEKGTFKYYYYCDNYRKSLAESDDGIAPYALQPASEFLRAASLQLNGNAENPSPTLVLGRVTRSYPIVQGLAGVKSGLTFPFPMLDAAGFAANDWPCRLKEAEIKMIRRNFSDDFNRYSQRMSFIYTESFNSANLQLLQLGKIHQEYAVLQPESLPGSVTRPPPLSRLEVNGNKAEFFDFVSGSTYSLLDEDGLYIYKDAALSAFNDLDFMKNKTVRTFTDFSECLRRLKKNQQQEYEFPGGVMIKANILLKDRLAVSAAGAMVICQGDISISASQPANNGRMFTLVSLDGNISLASGCRVDAALVALNGEVKLGAGSMVEGTVACKSLKFELTGNPGVRINYAEKFDPTSVAARNRSYRLCFAAEEYYLVE